MTGGLLHEQYEDAQGRAVLFECTECGYRSQSLGSLHAHVEGHWSTLGWFRWHVVTSWGHIFGLDISNKWMDYTRVIAVDTAEEISLDDVDGL